MKKYQQEFNSGLFILFILLFIICYLFIYFIIY